MKGYISQDWMDNVPLFAVNRIITQFAKDS